MHLQRLWLEDFRCYRRLEISFGPGLTAVIGGNGHGKTSLLEAVAYLATLKSFRGVPADAMVRSDSPQAIVRAEGFDGTRSVLIEAEINARGRSRIQVNRQRLQRSRDLLGVLRVSVFSPDDLDLIKGGPAGRRAFCDDTLVALSVDNHQLQADYERVLRQRNTLLRQAKGRLSDDIATTLDVWDEQLSGLGDELGRRRRDFVTQLTPGVCTAYDRVANQQVPGKRAPALRYEPPWLEPGLGVSLAQSRADDVRRGVTLIGPHRDELDITLGGLPVRTHASQGEQRSMALALRLAAHSLVTETVEQMPLLLLDDVFSELDAARCEALVQALPSGQTLLTTAGELPPSVAADDTVLISDGAIA